MPNDYDAIVVGARCAGSSTAMLLARKGYRVLLLDRASFPSDTLSTHYVHQPGIALLKQWGLLEKVIESNCPPVSEYTLDVGYLALKGSPPPADGVADAYAPRRKVLDQILIDAAVEAGVELRERFSVNEVLMDGERVVGVAGHPVGGGMVTEKAQLVIGADGLHSLVARSVDASLYEARPTLTCAYYTYWSGVPMEGVELYPRPGRMIIAAPTNDGQTITIVYWPHAAFHEVRANIEGDFMEALDLAPSLAERVRGGTRSEQFRGSADLPNYFRRSYGPGWALVGDAGHHKDPILALGITDAFRGADLLAEAVDAGHSGRQSLTEALAHYQRERDKLAAPGFESTYQFAKLEPPSPEMQQLFAALSENQEQTNRLFGTFAGTVPAAEFFAPGNMQSIFAAHYAANSTV